MQINMPIITIQNEDYDSDQEQEEFIKLPISADLIFMRYKDGGECENPGDPVEEHKVFMGEDEEVIHGFIFYYQ